MKKVMKDRAAVAMLSLGLVVPALASSSRVTAVTVYPAGAEVVRTLRASLEPGDQVIVFEGLPWGIDRDSLQVAGKGHGLVLGAVDLDEVVREPRASAAWQAADAEVRRLEAEIASMEGEAAVDQELESYLRALKATSAQRAAEETGRGAVDPASVRQVYAFVAESLGQIKQRQVQRARRQEELRRELKVARARRKAAQGRGDLRFLNAAVHLRAEAAGPAELTLRYLVREASWRPVYRFALDPAQRQMTLAYEAVVRQSTGEDWDDVALAVSTSTPSAGLAAPRLVSWYLRRRPVHRALEKRRQGRVEGPRASRDATTGVESARLDEALAAPARIEPAQVDPAGYDVTFRAAGRSRVPADNRDHRVVLRREELDVELSHLVAAELRQGAFLVARTRVPEDYPLLAGKARVYVGTTLLGRLTLAAHAPGEELKISFGEDKQVRVRRLRLPGRQSSSGLTGKYRLQRFAYRTTIENPSGRPIEVGVEERMPVSEDERIRVELGDGTTGGWEKDPERPGVMTWKLEIPPRSERSVEVHYSVRAPKDLPWPL
ncbi:MAG: DUF4139 domain-containing protein [Acidobacteriota bacterium]|nr:DUF4139 domain-containing protein [Acidobacteriota bacterium]MDQ7087761.1 DUF4139 domain-containing protein [Acidobacteriota bacterium]